MSLPSSIPFAVFLLACPAPAQSTPGGGHNPLPLLQGIDWPDALTAPVSFQDACLGRFYGDVSTDGAVLADAHAYLIYDVFFQASVFDRTPAGEAIAAIAEVVPPAVEDPWGLALAGDAGVWLHVEPGPAALIATGAPWNDLSHLRGANLDGAGSTDLIGATASSVHLLHNAGSGWVEGEDILLPGPVYEVAEVDWNGDGDHEIATLWSLGLSVFESNGVLLDFFIGSASGGRIAPMPPMDGFATGRVAWVFPAGSNGSLFVVSPGGTRQSCGGLTAPTAAIASGLFTVPSGAQRVNLLTTALSDANLRYLVHQHGGNPYDAGSPELIDSVVPTPYGACRIAMRDISSDGAADALFGRPGAEQIFLVHGAEVTFAGAGYPKLEPMPFMQPVVGWDNGIPWFQVHLDFNTSGYSHLQVRLWRSDDGENLDPVELENAAFKIEDWDPALANAEMRFAVPLPTDPCGDGYYFTMRLVTFNNGNIASWSPTVSAGFTFDGSIAAKMDDTEEGWLEMAGQCGGPSTAPCLIKTPVWARIDPYASPQFQPLVTNPEMPPVF